MERARQALRQTAEKCQRVKIIIIVKKKIKRYKNENDYVTKNGKKCIYMYSIYNNKK